MNYEKITWFPGNVRHIDNTATIKPVYGKNIGKLQVVFAKDPDSKIQKLLVQIGNPFRRLNQEAVKEALKKGGYQETE